MRSVRFNRGGKRPTWTILWTLALASWLATLPVVASGQDEDAEPNGGEEPRTLLSTRGPPAGGSRGRVRRHDRADGRGRTTCTARAGNANPG